MYSLFFTGIQTPKRAYSSPRDIPAIYDVAFYSVHDSIQRVLNTAVSEMFDSLHISVNPGEQIYLVPSIHTLKDCQVTGTTCQSPGYVLNRTRQQNIMIVM